MRTLRNMFVSNSFNNSNKLNNTMKNSNKKSRSLNTRRLQIESLESRELLSVSADFGAIRSQYADLNLSANINDYNVIEITASQLSDATALRNAIATAATTQLSDLIIVHTTELQNTITLTGERLSVTSDYDLVGDVLIVTLGDAKLTIDADEQSSVLYVGSSAGVLAGGITFTGGVAEINSGMRYGGAIYNDGYLVLDDCVITGNSSSQYGGGIGNAGDMYIFNSTVSNNYVDATSDGAGGGIGNDGYLGIYNSIITGNSASQRGGGIGNGSTGQLELINSLIVGNQIFFGATGNTKYSGGLFNAGVASCYSSTFASNKTNEDFLSEISYTQIYATGVQNPLQLKNCIIDGQINNNTGYVNGYNCLYAGTSYENHEFDTGSDNIFISQYIFVSVGSGDYRLKEGSQAIDAGNNSYVSEANLTTDLAGNARISGDKVDIGAYEFVTSTVPSGYNAYEWNLVESQGLTNYATWEEIDSEYRLTEIETYYIGTTGSLNLSNCTELQSVRVIRDSMIGSGTLTSLNVSGCTALEKLICNGSELTSLDVSGLTNLTTLQCTDNQLNSLNISGCTNLTVLQIDNNQLTSLNVSALTKLKTLGVESNRLTTLDVSKNTILENLWCAHNQLTTLDVSKNTELIELSFTENQLTTLDVSKNTKLDVIDARENQLTSLDVSKNTLLTRLYCTDNQLTTLDVSGLANLQDLWCGSNQLTSLNVSGCTALEELSCSENKLTSLDVSQNTLLAKLDCYENQLTSLNVSALTKLKILSVPSNRLTTLDVSKNTLLETLVCSENQLTSLNVSGLANLQDLFCSNNQLTSLNVSGLTKLEYLYCEYNQLTSLNVSGLANLEYLDCEGNKLTFATLPQGSFIQYLYGDQADISIGLNGYVLVAGSVDLQSQYNAGGGTTTYTWKYESGTAVSSSLVTNTNGVFTFDSSLEGERIYCEMINTAFPNATLKTETVNIVTEILALPTPQNLRAVTTGQTTVALDWNDVAGATGYIVQRKTSSDADFTTFDPVTSSKFTDSGLMAETEYEYRVQAIGSGVSPYATLTVTTAATINSNNDPIADTPIFTEPVFDEEENSVTLKWTNLGAGYTYILLKAGNMIEDFDPSSSEYVDAHPAAAGFEGYGLVAYHAQSYSSPLITVVYTTAKPLEITGHEVFETPQGTQFTLLWKAETGLTYNIYRKGEQISEALSFSDTIGSWTDENPDEGKNEYRLVAFYYDPEVDYQRPTFSNPYELNKPTQTQSQSAAALDAFWADYDFNLVDDDVLNAIA